MKKLILSFFLLVTLFSFSQDIKAITVDGKSVILKSSGDWFYLEPDGSIKKSENYCNCNEIDEKESRKSGFLNVTESSAYDLKKHISVDVECEINKIKIINASEQKGSAVYVVCVCDKKMKYRRAGSVFYKDGDNPVKLN